MKRLYCLCWVLLTGAVLAAPNAELDPYWQGSGEQTLPVPQAWQAFLEQYVEVVGEHHLVRYSDVSDADQARLNQWISQQASLDPRQLTPNSQFAYWVNLYNALTIQTVLAAYPVDSIKDIGWFNRGPWHRDLVEITGRAVSLNDIEHRILRPTFNDHRIHYVVNCAALGCPNLPLTPLRSEQLEAQLTQAEAQFLASDKGVRATNEGWMLSSIFTWYQEDFAANEAGLIDYLNQHVSPATVQQPIRYDYDWRLNEAP